MTDAKLNGLADPRDRLPGTVVPAVNAFYGIGVGKSYRIAVQGNWYGGENMVLDLSSPVLQVSTRMRLLASPYSVALSLVEVDSGGTARIIAGDAPRWTEQAGQVRGPLADNRWIMTSALPAGEVIGFAAQQAHGDIAMAALPTTMLVVYLIDMLGTVPTHGIILDNETCTWAPEPVEAALPYTAVSQLEWHRRIVDPDFFLHGSIDAATDLVGEDDPVDEIVEDGGISAVRAQQLFLGKRTVGAPRADRPRDEIAPPDGSVDGPVDCLAADRVAALFRGIRRPK